MFLITCGTIGVGKTAATILFGERNNYSVILETVEDHPYLENYYGCLKQYNMHSNKHMLSHKQAMHKSAFETQMHFLIDRFRKHFEARAFGNCIADRSIYEDEVFAKMITDSGMMDKNNYYKTYLPHFQLLCGLLYPPEMMIYLTADIEVVEKRQIKRAREMEEAIPRAYNVSLMQYYDRWFENYPYTKFKIDTCELTVSQVVDEMENILKVKVIT